MRRPVDHRAMAIAGFAEPWSGPAGTRRRLSLSTDGAVESVRIRRLDRDGMPVVDWPIETLPDRPGLRDFEQGSWAGIEGLAALGRIDTIAFEFMPTRNSGQRVLLDCGSFRLLVEGDVLQVESAAGRAPLGTLPARQWLEAKLDFVAGSIAIASLEPFKPFHMEAQQALPQPERLVLLADGQRQLPSFNCRLGQLGIGGAAGTAQWAMPTLFTAEPLPAKGAPLRMVLHNNPTFCVTSARWDGSALDPRLAPSHYDAVHFHDTDMAGLDWPPSHAVDVPAEAESGVYAFEVAAGGAVERLTFFVAAGEPRAPLLFVVPTATYLAYADEYLPPHLYEWVGSDRGHEFARDNELRSLYDYHSDASGVSLASTRRPKATLRDDYRYPLCGDPHNLPVDLHFLKFCARSGIAIDVATDHDLNEGGAALLARYRGVVTGSHPEYLSAAMETAYRTYIGGGGRLAYLGGNGFAAAVAFRGDLMELRRGPTQPGRTWDGPLGEMHLALSGEPGGFWRDRGRGEFSLTGVGIALMGFSRSLPFTRSEASRRADFSFLFSGIDGDSFGAEGLVMGGAAGYEVDATNVHLGSPADIIVLATAEGFPPDYVGDPSRWYEGGPPAQAQAERAEMTWWQHPTGGVIFSASSVAFLGALPGPGADNAVGRLTRNLLTHFAK